MKIFVLVLVFLAIVFLVWWVYSKYKSIPCPAWLSRIIEMDNPLFKVHGAASIVANGDVQSGMVVLDAGCGPGRVTIPLAKKVGSDGCVVAIDLQKEMLARAEEKAKEAHLDNIVFLQGGLSEGRLEEGRFDKN